VMWSDQSSTRKCCSWSR